MSLDNAPISQSLWTDCNANCATQGLKPLTCGYLNDETFISTCSPEGGHHPNVTSSAPRRKGWSMTALVLIVLALTGQALADDILTVALGNSTASANAP